MKRLLVVLLLVLVGCSSRPPIEPFKAPFVEWSRWETRTVDGIKWVKYEHPPIEITRRADGAAFYESRLSVDVEGGHLGRIWVFQGLDHGDIVELTVELYDENGFPLWLSSPHKEGLAMYPGWVPAEIYQDVRSVSIYASCRAGTNQSTEAWAGINGRIRARIHWGIWLEMVNQ